MRGKQVGAGLVAVRGVQSALADDAQAVRGIVLVIDRRHQRGAADGCAQARAQYAVKCTRYMKPAAAGFALQLAEIRIAQRARARGVDDLSGAAVALIVVEHNAGRGIAVTDGFEVAGGVIGVTGRALVVENAVKEPNWRRKLGSVCDGSEERECRRVSLVPLHLSKMFPFIESRR